MLSSHRSSTHLVWFGILSILIHGAVWLIWSQTWQEYLLQQSESSDLSIVPVDYIEIPPELAAEAPPDEAEFQASRNSVAGGTSDPDRPLSTLESVAGTSQNSSTSGSGTPQQSRSLPPVIQEEPQERDRPFPTREEILSSLNDPEVFDSTARIIPDESLSSSDSPLSQPSEPQVGNHSLNGTLNVDGNAVQPGVNAQATPNLAPYIDQMRRQVRQAWIPSAFQTSRRTVIEFSIQRDGWINEPRVIESSGVSEIDQEAIAAIQDAVPFAPLPQEYTYDTLTIHFSFTITAW